jgi:hypothetical protein
MMYVSGETAEASPETTGMIEEIVRQQVIEMVCMDQSASIQDQMPGHEFINHVRLAKFDIAPAMY